MAIAYPSNYNQLKTNAYTNAYMADIKSPNIAFFSDISSQAFQKGKLRWKLQEHLSNGSLKLVEEKDAYWVVTDSTCNLTVAGGQFDSKIYEQTDYRLQLNYEISKTEVRTTTEWNDVLGRYVKKNKNVIVTESTNIADWWVTAQDGYYHKGYNGGRQTTYEKPFVGIRLNSVTTKTSAPNVNARGLSFYKKYMAADGVNPLRYQDPYTYITYMSNYGLVGGWTLSNKRLAVNATTAQSLIYHDRGGVYEGAYKSSYGSLSDYNKVKSLSIYDGSQWKSDCLYPLPVMTDAKYNYAIGGRERAYTLLTSGKDDKYRATYLIQDLYAVYSAVDRFDSNLRWELQYMMGFSRGDYSTSAANTIENLMETNTGVYLTSKSTLNPDVRIEMPYYQLGILWGSQFNNKGDRKQATMWSSYDDLPKDYSRPQEERSEDILLGLVGNYPTRLVDIEYNQVITGTNSQGNYVYGTRGGYLDFIPKWDNITQIKVTYYRVNAYNFKKAEYTVSDRAYLNMGPCNSRYTYTIKNPSDVLSNKTNMNSYIYKNY